LSGKLIEAFQLSHATLFVKNFCVETSNDVRWRKIKYKSLYDERSEPEIGAGFEFRISSPDDFHDIVGEDVEPLVLVNP